MQLRVNSSRGFEKKSVINSVQTEQSATKSFPSKHKTEHELMAPTREGTIIKSKSPVEPAKALTDEQEALNSAENRQYFVIVDPDQPEPSGNNIPPSNNKKLSISYEFEENPKSEGLLVRPDEVDWDKLAMESNKNKTILTVKDETTIENLDLSSLPGNDETNIKNLDLSDFSFLSDEDDSDPDDSDGEDIETSIIVSTIVSFFRFVDSWPRNKK
jgi:hypothetical protein